MINGKILTYWLNSLANSGEGKSRNQYVLKEVSVPDAKQFQSAIEECLDTVRPGQGYVLVNWSGRMFVCEKDPNQPAIPYVRHEIKYHPLQQAFD